MYRSSENTALIFLLLLNHRRQQNEAGDGAQTVGIECSQFIMNFLVHLHSMNIGEVVVIVYSFTLNLLLLTSYWLQSSLYPSVYCLISVQPATLMQCNQMIIYKTKSYK